MTVYRTTVKVKDGTLIVDLPNEFNNQEVNVLVEVVQPSSSGLVESDAPQSVSILTFHSNADLVNWLRSNPPAPDMYADIGDDAVAWIARQREQRRRRELH
ncbi:MAG: hypothetical protein SNJ54_02210 [Anaerolineae bacterium]